MIELGKAKRQAIQFLCQDNQEVLVQAVMEGSMGCAFVPTLENPSYCLTQVGDFSYVLGLPPKGEWALDLRTKLYESSSESSIIIPGDERWSMWLEEQFHGQYRLISRYRMKKDEYHFDTEKLVGYTAQIPDDIRIRRIDDRLYQKIMKEDWSRDLCSAYDDQIHFLEHGMGYAALEGSKVVSGCSAYGSCKDTMEIEISTRNDYRRRGLALACSAAFILECLKQDIFPSWDAASLHSVEIAEKLGYVYDREYQVYHVSDSYKDSEI